MSNTSMARTRTLIALAVALVTTACSLLVNTDKNQCSADSDCTRPAACVQGVCVLGAVNPDGGDAQSDGPTTDGGCVPKPPVSPDDFLNEKCTNSECIPFDNCARVGVCDGGLPPLVTPPTGGI